MSLAQDKPAPVQESGPRRPAMLEGRSELIVVAVLYAVAIFLAVGTASMNVQGSATPGPRFFPILVCIALFAVATALASTEIRMELPSRDKRSRSRNSSAYCRKVKPSNWEMLLLVLKASIILIAMSSSRHITQIKIIMIIHPMS